MRPFVIIFVFTIGIFQVPLTLPGQSDSSDINFGHYRILHSEILDQDRILYIHLPEDYHRSNTAYPVVFQLYSHFTYNYYLPAIRATQMMATMGEAPGIIVVGLMNREFRYRDLLPEDHWGGTSEIEKFQGFFQKELIPFLKERYRVQDYRILSGPQAGAAFGLYTLAEYPEVFNAVIISNPFWIQSCRSTLLEKFSQASIQNDFDNKFLMITYGKEMDKEEIQCLDSLSLLAGSIQDSGFEYHLNPIEPGSAFTASTGIEKGLKLLFRDFPYPRSDSASDLAAIERHYHSLSQKFAYQIAIPELALVYQGDQFIQEENPEKALEIFQKMHELYPEGLMGLDRLGSLYRQKGEYALALEYYRSFLEKQAGDPRVSAIVKSLEKEVQ